MDFMDVDKELSLESEDSTSNPGKRKPGRKKIGLPPKASASCQTPPEMKRVAPKFPSRFLNGVNNTIRNSQGSNSPAAPPPPPLPPTSTSTYNNHTGGGGSLGNVNRNEPTTATAAVASTAECDVVAADTEPGVVVEVEVTSSSSTPPSPGSAGPPQSQANEVIGTVPTSTTSTPSLTSMSTSSSSSSSSGSGGAAAGVGGDGGGDQEVPPPPSLSMDTEYNAHIVKQSPPEKLESPDIDHIDIEHPHPQMGLLPRYNFGGDWRDSLSDGERFKRITRDPRFEHMLDAHFKVGPEREVIKAPRFILAANCQYFENCFSGKDVPKEICMVFPTLDPAGFRFMLDYIYTKVFNIAEFWGQMDLLQTGQLVLKSADCAQHIGYAEFEKIAIQYMHTQINEENALVLLVLFRQMCRPGLEAVALQFLNQDIRAVFTSEYFVAFSSEGLAEFLSCDFWYLPEKEVFEQAKSWAVNRIVYGGQPCEGPHEIQVTAPMIRETLGVAFFQIRFLLLLVEDFTNILTRFPGLFSATEIGNIMEYLISPQITAPPQPYVARRRIQPPSPSASPPPPPPPEANDTSASELPEQPAPPPPASPSATPAGSVTASMSPMLSLTASPSPPESNGQDKSISNENDADKPEAEKSEQEPTPHCSTRGRPSRTQQQAAAAATAHKSQRRKRRYKSRAFAGPAAKKRKMKDEFDKVRPDFSEYVTSLAATTDTVALAESTTSIQGHFTLADMPQSRIYLPNIKNFFLNLDPPQKTPSGEDLRAAMKSQFSRLSNLIFFDLSVQRSTKRLGGLMRQIFARKINLTIVYYGATIVKVCHAKGSLTMTMLGDAQEVLNICCQSDFELKNLAIHECRLWKLNMVKWDKLDSVVMNGVDGVSNWREIVRACKRVSQFVCDGLGGQKIDIYSDVLKGKEKLSKLYLGHTNLTCKNFKFPPHEGLEEMYLDSVTCPEELVQEFPRVFPNVKRMLMFELNECEPLALFHVIQMPSLEFIHVWDIKKPTDERAVDIRRLRVLLTEIFGSTDLAKTDLPFMIRLTSEGKRKRVAATATSGSKKIRHFDPFDGVNWSGMVVGQDPSSTDADEEVEKVYRLDYSQGSYENFFDCFETFYLWETAPDETEGGTDTETEASPANGRA